MNIQFATRAIGTARLALKAHAPTLMVAGGVVSMGAAVVTASQKTLKLDEVLGGHVETLENINNAVGQRSLTGEEYTSEDARHDRFKVIYPRIGVLLAKHYLVPGVLFVGGAALVFGGHRIMLKRNATLAVAFTTLQKAYARYRQNAVEAMGPEFDRAMLKGYVNREVINEDGTTEVVSDLDWDAEDGDPYNRVFNQATSTLWRPDLGMNRDLLEIQQQYAQQRLNARGYLYLSEVYESLGIDESSISRVVGWKVKRNPDGTKDIPMVDFGLNKVQRDDYAYTRDHEVYLDFNCQGYIVGGTVQKLLEKA